VFITRSDIDRDGKTIKIPIAGGIALASGWEI